MYGCFSFLFKHFYLPVYFKHKVVFYFLGIVLVLIYLWLGTLESSEKFEGQ